jgi:GAF domain-containing protein
VLQTLVDVAADILRADKTVVLVWDTRGERLVVGAARGFGPAAVAALARAPGEGVIGRVALRGEPIAVADARVPRHLTEAEGVRSLVHVPIVVGGEVFGVFGVHYCRPRPVGRAEQRLPWEPPVLPAHLTPGRVQRAFSTLLLTLGTPAAAPKPCGRSPGRPKGRRSARAARHPPYKKPVSPRQKRTRAA